MRQIGVFLFGLKIAVLKSGFNVTLFYFRTKCSSFVASCVTRRTAVDEADPYIFVLDMQERQYITLVIILGMQERQYITLMIIACAQDGRPV